MGLDEPSSPPQNVSEEKALSYSIRENFAEVVLAGTFSMDEAIQVARAAFRDPRFEKGMSLLGDLRGSQSVFSAEDIERGASFVAGSSALAGAKYAIVADDSEQLDQAANHGLRVILLAGGMLVRMFTVYEDAVARLGES